MSRWGVAVGTLLVLGSCSSRPPRLPAGTDLEALRSLMGEVSQERLMSTVRELAQVHQEDTPLDCHRWPEVIPFGDNWCHLTSARATALVQSRFEALDLRVRLQHVDSDIYPTTNVIADLPGHTHPEEVVLVGAHTDAFFSGADDNSSGVAGMLELARVLSSRRFARTVRFVGFDLEEVGSEGSFRYVQRLEPGERLAAVLVLESIGYYDSSPGSQRTMPGLPSRDRGDFIAAIGNAPSSRLVSELYAINEALEITDVLPILSAGQGISPMVEALLRSDHEGFWLAGHQALFLTDTAPFRNPNYHKITDTPDTLSPEPFTRTVKLATACVAAWAGGVP
ncbi:hypothetical protein BO221_26535 [Archangium sp. Cb G35]|uniref:M28 family peptidase n=1 Tax=Archangium sp. Cb G35 TaxID=1920190 RepID=UPI000936B374|nr:M28 family peptidase [Archangium sp. Cb G35]OJT21382.1 hypothetical protein BO221_26535 [Archangium sp. Cb G35]